MQVLDEKLLTYEQLSKIINIAPITLRVWVMNKKIPFIKIGKCVRFHPKTINKWLELNTSFKEGLILLNKKNKLLKELQNATK
jgi:excisionase family DNA binding protein